MSRTEVSKKLVILNSASSALSLVLNLAVLIWLNQYLLKRISPDEYSLIPVILSIMAFSPMITSVLTGGISRFVTVAYAKGDDAEIKKICSSMFPILCLSGAILLGGGLVVAWNVDTFIVVKPEYLSDAQLMLGLLVVVISVRLPLAAFGSGFIVRQKLYQEDILNAGCQLLRVTIVVTLLIGVSASVLWVIVAQVISDLVFLIFFTLVSVRLLPSQKLDMAAWNINMVKALVNFGMWNFVIRFVHICKEAVNPLVLNRISTSVDVSVFHVGALVPRQIKVMLTPISRPFIPVLAIMSGANDLTRLRNTYLRVARYHAWVVLSVSIPAIVFSTEIIHLYIDGLYDEAGPIMAILLFTVVLNSYNALGPGLCMAIGKIKGLALRSLLVLTGNLCLLALFVGLFQQGAYGAAIATLLTTVLLEPVIIWTHCRHLANTSFDLWIKEAVIPSALPSIAPLIFCLLMKMLLFGNSWLGLFAISITSMTLYFVLVFLFWLTVQDKADIQRLALKQKGRRRAFLEFLSER